MYTLETGYIFSEENGMISKFLYSYLCNLQVDNWHKAQLCLEILRKQSSAIRLWTPEEPPKQAFELSGRF